MGKNTPLRQDFIINNLRIEEDIVEEDTIHFEDGNVTAEASFQHDTLV